jgi:hypothetical protein
VSRAKPVVDKLRKTPQLTLIGAASALVSMDIELWNATIATTLDTYDTHSRGISILSHLDQDNSATASTSSASECDRSSTTWCNRSSDHLQEL